MKRWILIAMTLLLVAMLCACSPSGNDKVDLDGTPAPQTTGDASPAQTDTEPATEPEPSQESATGAQYELTKQAATLWESSIGTTWIQALVEIKNTGDTNLYLSSGAYDVEDSAGALVCSSSMFSAYPNVIAPGEVGYMYETATLDEAVEGDLVLLPREDVREATVDLIRYATSDVKISGDTYTDLKIKGRVENTSDEASKMTYVTVVLYDDAGEVLGIVGTIITEELAPAQKIGFEVSGIMLPFFVTSEKIADYKVWAYPMQIQFDFN